MEHVVYETKLVPAKYMSHRHPIIFARYKHGTEGFKAGLGWKWWVWNDTFAHVDHANEELARLNKK